MGSRLESPWLSPRCPRRVGERLPGRGVQVQRTVAAAVATLEVEQAGEGSGDCVEGPVDLRQVPFCSTNARIELWSVRVWSTWLCLAQGEITSRGRRGP